MAERSGFFPYVPGDTNSEYNSDWLATYIASIIGNGTYDGELGVTADGSTMSVTLPAGRAWINGYLYRNDGPLTLVVDNADGVLNRIDIIVLRWDINARSITAQVVKGTPASSATAQAITRSVEQYDLKLAEISIPAGTTAITQSLITDCRLDKSVCGIVTGAITQVDTATFYNQIQADLAEFKATNETNFAKWHDAKYAEFNSWLSTMQNIPPADAAAYLQGQINSRAYSKLDCKKTGTVYALSGLTVASGLVPCVFKADVDYNFGDTFTISGDAITVALPDGSGLEDGFFKAGTVLTGVYDTDSKTLNFKSGGSDYDTLPAQVSNFYATIGNASVVLSWINPSDENFSGVLILRKTGGYPQRPSDGDRVYSGTGTTYTDTGLTNGTQYYYRAFAYNSKKQCQTVYCVATMTPLAGHELGSMPVGTKLKFGAIFGNPIIQKVANISGSDVTLITDGIIARYALDAKEPLNGDSNRKNYGNNRYVLSNIHQWLNSEAGAGSWYAAQHGADQPPDSTSVVTVNPYKSVAGFLNGFSTKEKNYLKTKAVTVGRSNTDGGGTETFNARVWLPSGTEVGLGTEFAEGSQLAAFTGNNDRIAYETADSAANCGGTSGAAWCYWLRTPYPSDSCDVRIVNTDGTLINDGYASYGDYGVRPLCVLDTSTMISLQPDSDGCYTVM
jgi:hypothetical protein